MVIFVLILVFGQRDHFGGPAPVRVGGFNSITQCEEQGAAALKDYADMGWYRCIPVNHLVNQ